MKTRNLFFAGLVGLSMIACSNEGEPEAVNNQDNMGGG